MAAAMVRGAAGTERGRDRAGGGRTGPGPEAPGQNRTGRERGRGAGFNPAGSSVQRPGSGRGLAASRPGPGLVPGLRSRPGSVGRPRAAPGLAGGGGRRLPRLAAAPPPPVPVPSRAPGLCPVGEAPAAAPRGAASGPGASGGGLRGGGAAGAGLRGEDGGCWGRGESRRGKPGENRGGQGAGCSVLGIVWRCWVCPGREEAGPELVPRAAGVSPGDLPVASSPTRGRGCWCQRGSERWV